MNNHTCGFARYGPNPDTADWRCIADYKNWPSLGCGAIWTPQEGSSGRTANTPIDAYISIKKGPKPNTPSLRDGDVRSVCEGTRTEHKPNIKPNTFTHKPNTNRTLFRTSAMEGRETPNRTSNRTSGATK